MTNLERDLRQYVADNDYVSFAELNRRFGDRIAGDCAIEGPTNLILWGGLSAEFVEMFKRLVKNGAIVFSQASSPLIYAIDGEVMKLPIAKRYRAYSKPRWLPVTLRPGPTVREGIQS